MDGVVPAAEDRLFGPAVISTRMDHLPCPQRRGGSVEFPDMPNEQVFFQSPGRSRGRLRHGQAERRIGANLPIVDPGDCGSPSGCANEPPCALYLSSGASAGAMMKLPTVSGFLHPHSRKARDVSGGLHRRDENWRPSQALCTRTHGKRGASQAVCTPTM